MKEETISNIPFVFDTDQGSVTVDALMESDLLHVSRFEEDGIHGQVVKKSLKTGKVRTVRLNLLEIARWRNGVIAPPLFQAKMPESPRYQLPGESAAMRLRILAGLDPYGIHHPADVYSSLQERVLSVSARFVPLQCPEPVSRGGFRYLAPGQVRFEFLDHSRLHGPVTEEIAIGLGLWVSLRQKHGQCTVNSPEWESELSKSPTRRVLLDTLGAMAMPTLKITEAMEDGRLDDIYEESYITWGMPAGLIWRRASNILRSLGRPNPFPNPYDPADRIPF